jgi:hypothetical protein
LTMSKPTHFLTIRSRVVRCDKGRPKKARLAPRTAMIAKNRPARRLGPCASPGLASTPNSSGRARIASCFPQSSAIATLTCIASLNPPAEASARRPRLWAQRAPRRPTRRPLSTSSAAQGTGVIRPAAPARLRSSREQTARTRSSVPDSNVPWANAGRSNPLYPPQLAACDDPDNSVGVDEMEASPSKAIMRRG